MQTCTSSAPILNVVTSPYNSTARNRVTADRVGRDNDICGKNSDSSLFIITGLFNYRLMCARLNASLEPPLLVASHTIDTYSNVF